MQPWRKFIYGYLSVCRRFEFFKAYSDHGEKTRFERSGLHLDAEGWGCLNRLLLQPLARLGFEEDSVAGWIVDKFLGTGATSAVFSAKQADGDDAAVCKVYLGPDRAATHRAREVRALTALAGDAYVPAIVPDAPARTPSGRYVLLLTPVGWSDVRLSIAEYAPIVRALQDAHTKDLFHNDISPDNLLAVRGPGDGRSVLLNDFGRATSATELADASSGYRSIATRSLFYANAVGELSFGAAADLRAVVRSVFYLTQRTFDPVSVTTAGTLEAHMRMQLPIWRAALELAGKTDYKALGKLLETGRLPEPATPGADGDTDNYTLAGDS